MDLNEISVFIEVVREGSFSRAAKKLSLPLSTVSYRVSSLEKRLGVQLLKRSTRRLKVTAPGQLYFQNCLAGLQSIAEAERALNLQKQEPTGLLRITTFYELANSALPHLICEFLNRFPKIQIQVEVSDRVVDLMNENFDLALRAGPLKDSTLKVRRIGVSHFGLFAAPAYLKIAGEPTTPAELSKYRCLQFTALGDKSWTLFSEGRKLRVSVPGRLLMNSLESLKKMALMGEGIALLPNYFAAQEVSQKKLVRVLPQWKTQPAPLHFVYPAQKYLNPAVEAFTEFSIGELKKSFVEPED